MSSRGRINKGPYLILSKRSKKGVEEDAESLEVVSSQTEPNGIA
jgi:hypothetical protein